MQSIDLRRKKIAALKEARDRCLRSYNLSNNPTIKECLQLTCETLVFTIIHDELELTQLLLTTRHGQRNDDRPNFKREPL
jgi:hypothetical protein